MTKGILEGVSNSLDAASTALSHSRSTSTTRMRNNHSNSHPLSILPRLARDESGYERVPEGGRMKKRFRWRWVGVGVMFLVVVVWALGPRERRNRVLDAVRPGEWGHSMMLLLEGY